MATRCNAVVHAETEHQQLLDVMLLAIDASVRDPLFCPNCHRSHVDDEDTLPHKKHVCEHCSKNWTSDKPSLGRDINDHPMSFGEAMIMLLDGHAVRSPTWPKTHFVKKTQNLGGFSTYSYRISAFFGLHDSTRHEIFAWIPTNDEMLLDGWVVVDRKDFFAMVESDEHGAQF